MPYREIANRNSFGLKPPVERPESPPLVSPLPKIRLAGITTILGRKIAFLVITATEPGGLPEWLVLAEGERQHEIEVAEIDPKRGTVKALNRGREETLVLGLTDGDTSPGVNPQVFYCPRAPSGNISQFPTNPVSPEGQTILIEAQRVKAIQDGDPIAKILPPTELTSEILGDE